MSKNLTDEEISYWTESIERDKRDIADGKPRKYVSSDDFWTMFEDAVKSCFKDR